MTATLWNHLCDNGLIQYNPDIKRCPICGEEREE